MSKKKFFLFPSGEGRQRGLRENTEVFHLGSALIKTATHNTVPWEKESAWKGRGEGGEGMDKLNRKDKKQKMQAKLIPQLAMAPQSLENCVNWETLGEKNCCLIYQL